MITRRAFHALLGSTLAGAAMTGPARAGSEKSPVAAVAGLDADSCFVDEHAGWRSLSLYRV